MTFDNLLIDKSKNLSILIWLIIAIFEPLHEMDVTRLYHSFGNKKFKWTYGFLFQFPALQDHIFLQQAHSFDFL